MEPVKTVGPVAQVIALFTLNRDLPEAERKSRKEMIDACVLAGINKATASTQYGKFHKGEGGSKERTGAVAKVKAIIAANYGQKERKDILDLCVSEGLNKATAATQYGAYHRNESSKKSSAPVELISSDKAADKPKGKGKGKAKAKE
jgi:hypothetical protein